MDFDWQFRLHEEVSFDGPCEPMSRSHPRISTDPVRRLCSIWSNAHLFHRLLWLVTGDFSSVCARFYAYLRRQNSEAMPSLSGSENRNNTSTIVKHSETETLYRRKRVRAVFYWAHVLGNNATIMPQRIRLHCQCAVSSLQLLLIATRGHRSYTVDELRTIYEGFGRMFFTHLETITEYLTQKKFDEKQRKHDEDPENNDAPTPWQREKRSVQVRL